MRFLRAAAESFNWKTAAISAILRATMFFFMNLRAGSHLALRATCVEAGYAICASGVLGAVTQRIRDKRPQWLVGLTIWCLLPLCLLTAQYLVHHAFGTPELKASMIGSFCFAAMGTGFNWFAMRRGALVTGSGRSFFADLRRIPLLLGEFLWAGPKALMGR